MNKQKILQVLLMSLMVFIILSITRSICLLYLAYTDGYFYNFDFNMKQIMQKNGIFNNMYYLYTYIIGLIFCIGLSKVLKVKWINFVISLLIGLLLLLLLFRLIESSIIRPLFAFFANPRTNLIIHIACFVSLLIAIGRRTNSR